MLQSKYITNQLVATKPLLAKRYSIERMAIFGSVARNETRL